VPPLVEGALQAGVRGEDGAVDIAQQRTGFDAEFTDEEPSAPIVDG
jgi:hypothetical protein